MNKYDKTDRVRREAVMIAGAMKVAAYRVRDPETDEWSKLQFHMTYNNMVLGLMGEESAKLFANFVTQTLASAIDSREAIETAQQAQPVGPERDGASRDAQGDLT